MVNFPSSLDSLSNPGATTKRNDPGFELHTVISTLNDIAEALEAKTGTGASTPANDTRLEGNGAGSSIWAKRSKARAYHNANQSISSSSVTALALNSERFDNDTMHDTSSNNSRLTCKTAGAYLITAHVEFAASAGGSLRQTRIVLNGATQIAVVASPSNGGTFGVVHSVATVYDLAVNDYVEINVFQDSGGSLNVSAVGNYSPELAMVRIG